MEATRHFYAVADINRDIIQDDGWKDLLSKGWFAYS